MPAYVIVNVHVEDAEAYEQYKAPAQASIKAHGGRYLVRGGVTEVLEGDVDLGRVVVLEFESMEQVRTWWSSPEYAAARGIRLASSTGTVFVVEGLAEPL
jgi:uncharacterized protein (DUF1330 family)